MNHNRRQRGGHARRPLEPVARRPRLADRTTRQRQIATSARALLEQEGPAALTMRQLAAALDIAAPSLYKHVPGKEAVAAMLVEDALIESGDTLRSALGRCDEATAPAEAVLTAYRRYAVAHPHLYRLVTGPGFRRDLLTPGLEDWSGEPFYLVTGEPHLAQAMWAFAHGAVVLEIDRRLADPGTLERTWQSAARAFTDAAD